MNSRLDLFNKQILIHGVDATVNGVDTKVLIRDIDNKGLIETKHIHVPLGVGVAIGDKILIDNNVYIVFNINKNNVFTQAVVQEMYHYINVKYSWMPLMTIDVIVQGVHENIVDAGLISYDDTSVYVLMQRNDTTAQLKKGTRFFLFNIPYKMETITWENSNIMKCKCSIDVINQNDDLSNKIAYNDFSPPVVKYNINASAGVGGTITPSGDIQVEHGTSQTFTITPNDDYIIYSVFVDGVVVPVNENKYTFTNIDSNHTINVTFTNKPVQTGEIVGDVELYIGYSNEYNLKGFFNPITIWTVDNPYVEILSTTHTTCEIICNKSTQVNKTFILSAKIDGLIEPITKSIKIYNL